MYVGYATFMVLRMIPTVTGASMRDDPTLDIDLAELGLIFAMGTVGGVVGKLIGGLAADWFGGKWTFTVGLLLASVFIGLFALADELWMFQATFFLALLAKSFGWPAMAKIIMNWFSPQQYGGVWGVLATSSRVGTLVATFALGALLTMMPWRSLLAVAAGAGILAVMFFAATLREHPMSGSLADHNGDRDSTSAPHPLDNLSLPAALVVFFTSSQFWLITGSLMGMTILWDFLLFVPLYLKDTLSLTVAQASMAASAFPLGSLVSVLAGGYVFDRLSRKQAARVFSLLLTLATGCIGTFLVMPYFGLTSASLTGLSVFLLFLFGVCVAPCYYIPMSVFAIEFGGPRSGVLIALLDAKAFGVNALFQLFAGRIAKTSWQLFLAVLMAVSVASLAMMFWFLWGEAARRQESVASQP
jgi:sugar phosphate permease